MTTTIVLIFQIAANTIWQLLPYVILGVLASEGLRYTSISKLLERGCLHHPAVAIPIAAVLGIVSPLCTYGTVPLVLHLLRTGVPVAPLATFLSTSSMMNPQLLLITWGGLGPKMASVRLLSVLVFGLLLGAILHFVPMRLSVQAGVRAEPEKCDKHRPPFRVKAFLRNSYKTLKFIGFYVLLGVLLGAAIEVLVPGRWIVMAFGGGGWFQILMASLLGVPVYVCGGGTIPLVRGLLEQGMPGGAALAFLISGPATRIPLLMAFATIARPFAVVAYVFILVAFSVFAGIIYGLL